MTHAESFDSFEAMMKAMSDAHDAAMRRVTLSQRELMEKALTTSVCWFRYYDEYNLCIFGKTWGPEEWDRLVEDSPEWEREEFEANRADVRENTARGYLYGDAYSTAETRGDIGSTHVSCVVEISKEDFEYAQSRGWDLSTSHEDHARLGGFLKAWLEEAALGHLMAEIGDRGEM